MRIQHNIMAMNAYRNYTNNVAAMKKNLEKLSSGYKINRAGDDAAGLAISEKMRAQITGLETAQKNAKDGISLVQTAEGALTEVHDMLNRMVELATQSANGTYDNETDRFQMQKEVEQLLDEIDRIADSSNFNGIKLLDGTLGLNQDAFGISAGEDLDVTDTSIDISSLLAAKDAGSPAVHLEGASTAAVTPAATIDLNNLEVVLDAATSAANPVSATLTFTIGGQDVTVKFTNSATGAGATNDASAIATALKNALVKAGLGVNLSTGAAVTGTNTGDAVRIGDAAYTVGGTGGKITLTYAGRYDGTTFTAETAFSGDEDAAAGINGSLGFDVTVATTGGTQTGDVVHKATNVDPAVAEKPASWAGIDLTLNGDIVKDGNTLTIDGKTFIFKTDANSTVTSGANTLLIDVSGFDAADQIHKAADLLSKQTVNGEDNRTWAIGVKGDGTVIHIEQTAASADGKELDTYEKLAGVISADGPAVTTTYKTTDIAIKDASKITEGDTLSIGDKKYVFTGDADKAGTTSADGKTVYVDKSDAANKLAEAIGDAATVSTDGKTVTVRSETAADKDTAPTVLGRGLTLQIGDTSDAFNQLNVKVQDMHAKSLGIGGLKIDTEVDAQAAINKIKKAINTVSDVRGTLGATQNRLDHTINNLSVMTENIQDAESTIRDTDVAEEMMAYTKNNILIQSAQAMLAQANQVPQGVLQLLQ